MAMTRRAIMAIVILSVGLICPAWADERPKDHLITVVGESEIKVAPNEVVVQLGVENWDKDLNVAAKENDEKVRKIIAAAKALGVEPKYLQTDFIEIHPRYKREHEKEIFLGFFVKKKVGITLRDVSKFDELLSSALQSGATHVYGISFRTTELKKYREQARSLAVKAAMEKASLMARELGQKVGKAHSIIETPPPSWSYGTRSLGLPMAQVSVQAPQEESSSVQETLALGQITIKARVTVSFLLE